MHILDTEPSSVIPNQTKEFTILERDSSKVLKEAEAKENGVTNGTLLLFLLTGSKIAMSSTKFVFFRSIHKKIALSAYRLHYFYTNRLQALYILQQNSTERKCSMSCTHFVYLVDPSAKMTTQASDWLAQFNFTVKTDETLYSNLTEILFSNPLPIFLILFADNSQVSDISSIWPLRVAVARYRMICLVRLVF